MGTGSLERSSGAAELPFSALRAVESDLGRLVELLVAAEERAPALLVGREPDGLALNALGDQSNALGAHRSSFTQRAGPATRNTVRLGSSPCAPTRVGGLRASAGALVTGPVPTAHSFGVRLGRPGWRPRRPRL